ncbi:MAG TPA: hypothetical protein VMB23_03400, partial [Spirochaetia bacterium]|nr:hypothetical protein [Spirochaetia bacterium]
GLAWGWVEALRKVGVHRLLTAVHTHHGQFPMGRPQVPFWWASPQGNRILVWSGDHYHLGNDLAFAPDALGHYLVRDHWGDQDRTDGPAIGAERLTRYLSDLERSGYPWDFLPILVSGALTDNSPPSAAIPGRLGQIGRKLGDRVHLRMGTLDQFFDHAEARVTGLPVYSGDWNDWWADGVGSTPGAVAVFREAQRVRRRARALGIPTGAFHEVDRDLVLFAEHTWGHSASVCEPWSPAVNELGRIKESYAARALEGAWALTAQELRARGEVPPRVPSTWSFRVEAPGGEATHDLARMTVDHWERPDGRAPRATDHGAAVDRQTGQRFAVQGSPVARGVEWTARIPLARGQTRTLDLEEIPCPTSRAAPLPLDRVDDARALPPAAPLRLEVDAFRGTLDVVDGLTGTSLVHPRALVPPFGAVYEQTPMGPGPTEVRRAMGRNRRSPETHRSQARIRGVRWEAPGPVWHECRVDWDLEGTRLYRTVFRQYGDEPRLDVRVQVHKESRWEPENLLVALPFGEGECWIDKTGCTLRPGLDQIPGTNQEFWALQNGMAWVSDHWTLGLAVWDSPLVTLGDPVSHPIELCQGTSRDLNRDVAYSWVMNNFWETNFRAEVGGFHEFRYSLFRMPAGTSGPEALGRARQILDGLVVTRWGR